MSHIAESRRWKPYCGCRCRCCRWWWCGVKIFCLTHVRGTIDIANLVFVDSCELTNTRFATPIMPHAWDLAFFAPSSLPPSTMPCMFLVLSNVGELTNIFHNHSAHNSYWRLSVHFRRCTQTCLLHLPFMIGARTCSRQERATIFYRQWWYSYTGGACLPYSSAFYDVDHDILVPCQPG
jgi:hypothetical protein